MHRSVHGVCGVGAQLLDRLDDQADAPSTARSTAALSPSPISSTSASFTATTTTLPGQAPSVFTKRRTVCGSSRAG